MLDDIKLFIDDRQVDLGQDPKIYYNWQLTDFTNPTATKNSFSKTLTLPGTKRNNDVFGHFWDLDRNQLYGGNSGAWLNPTYRIPFSLYINGNMFEKGYIKLQKVKRKKDGECEYEVGLFGGLGTFLYNLTTDWNSGEQKKLGDLQYYVADTATTLDFTINAQTVLDAWNNISTYSSKWSAINFAPCYNGLNDKMTCDKAVVNLNNMGLFVSSATEDNTTYVANNGWVLANLPDKLTEFETCDLRSWCQRPVVRVKSVIDAITRKENNSGWFDDGFDVELDREFFNSRNPYYEDAWITLPMITSLKIKTNGETESTYTANYVQSYDVGNINHSIELVYNLNNAVEKYGTSAEITFDLMINVPTATLDAADDILYPSGVFKANGASHTERFTNVYALQGLATIGTSLDAAPLGGSDVKWLEYNRTGKFATAVFTFQNAKYKKYYTPRYDTEETALLEGYFVRYNQKVYRWNTPITINIPLPIGTDSFRVRLDRLNNTNNLAQVKYLYNRDKRFDLSALRSGSTVSATTMCSNRDYKIKTGNLSNFYSNTEISQKDILATSFSPGEWFMDYCRMFGLYVHKDLYDDKIYVDTRNTFFQRDKVMDISGNIDWGQGADINPTVCEAGYYRMKDIFWEGGAYKDYSEKFGKIYGSKLIITGYEFDADTKDLISSKMKACVQVRKDGKYYFKPLATWDADKQIWTYFHPYVFDGLSYVLYSGGVVSGDTIDIEIPKKIIAETFDPFVENQPFYDLDDRPEFCDASNKALDGSGVLLFLAGTTDLTNMEYYLTDDLDEMSRLNNNPCYILTASEYDKDGNRVGYLLSSIPKFSRYWYSFSYVNGNLYRKNIQFSMDFGSPRQLYLLDYTDYESSNLYSQFYKDYYTDMYGVDTKVLTLYFHPGDIMDSDWLRRFYWFENCIWRLNKVSDYSPLSADVVKCEFVKVNDLNAMTNIIPSKEVELTVVLDKYTIDGSGGTIVATVSTSDHSSWYVDGWDYDNEISISPLSYPTDGTFTITVPEYYGASNRQVGITVAAGDISVRVYFTQTPLAGSMLTIQADTPIPYNSTSIIYTATTRPGATIQLLRNGVVSGTTSVSSGTSINNFSIPANTGSTQITWVLSGQTTDSQATASKNVVQNGYVAPPVLMYITFDSITNDKQSGDLDNWTITDGYITVNQGATELYSVGVQGNASTIGFNGYTTFQAYDTGLTNVSILVNFSDISWNTTLAPNGIYATITLNSDQSITFDSDGGMSGAFDNIDLTQYASGEYITLDFWVRIRPIN